MLKVGIIGATGYGGLEIIRILSRHPKVEIQGMSSVSFEGKKLSDIYPSMKSIQEKKLEKDTDILEKCDVIFASLPHGLSQNYAKYCFDNKKTFIDLGADFRLESEEAYQEWYKGDFKNKEVHEAAVYALPELFREKIKGSRIIANPGCYPTSVALGLAPLAAGKRVDCSDILVDSKSGVTGAGRSLSQNTHFPDCNEGFAPYKVGEHRHTPEIEQTLEKLCGGPATVTFVPHLLPINRGILSTIYTKPTKNMDLAEIYNLYTDFYKDEPFVRVLDMGAIANVKNVTYSNYCDISLHKDDRTGKIIVVSVIDNMVKGAAGQAVQNMNIVCGFDEALGLDIIPPAF